MSSVYGVDYLNNDPVPLEVMQKGGYDIMAWFKNHGPEQTTPPLLKVIEGLKAKGITAFGATGYCKSYHTDRFLSDKGLGFGGRYVFNLAFDNVISVSVISHPSLLKVPEDLEVRSAILRYNPLIERNAARLMLQKRKRPC